MTGPDVFGLNPYASKRAVVARVVAVLRGVNDQRGLQLTAYRSRAVPAGQIHELMITDDPAELETMVNRVALLCFFEIERGGVLLVGDQVTCEGRVLGELAGFDETHMPNHQNVCLRGAVLDGVEVDLQPGAELRFAR